MFNADCKVYEKNISVDHKFIHVDHRCEIGLHCWPTVIPESYQLASCKIYDTI